MEYQRNVVSGIYRTMNKNKDAKGIHRTGVVALPTGGGKSVVAGHVVHDCVNAGGRSLFLVSFLSLLNQTNESFLNLSGVESSLIASGVTDPNPDAMSIVASIATLKNRPKPKGVKLIFVDEAHTAGFTKSQSWIFDVDKDGDWLHWDPNCWIWGLSATPKRTKKTEWLGQRYTHLVAGPEPRDLMQLGLETDFTQGLCFPHYKGFLPGSQIDLKTVKTYMGDYAPKELDRKVNTPEVTQNIIREWQKLAIGDGDIKNAKLALFFGTSLDHAKNFADAINLQFKDAALKAGFNDGNIAKFLKGDDDAKEREYWFNKLKSREILLLSSVDIISVGFNVKEIEIVITRPTKSEIIQEQQEGRGARIAPHIGKKSFYVFDVGLNSLSLDRMDSPKNYSIEKKRSRKKGQAPQKQCPECGEILMTLRMVCTCGYQFPIQEKDSVDGDFVTLESKEDLRLRTIYQRHARVAARSGYLPGYAGVKFIEETKTSVKASQVAVGSTLLLKKSDIPGRLTFSTPGGTVHAKVKSVAFDEGSVQIITGQGTIQRLPDDLMDVIQSPKKEWKLHAIFSEPKEADKRWYIQRLSQCAARRGLSGGALSAWVDGHYLAEFGEHMPERRQSLEVG